MNKLNLRFWSGLTVGVLWFALTLLFPAPAGFEPEAWRLVGVAGMMAAFWLTECIPITATALIPLAAYPPLHILPIPEAAAPFANPLIFLFLGGFLLAHAIEKCGLHRRLALRLLWHCHPTPRGMVLGLLVSSALISMWVSNTATAMMMLPIALSVLSLVPESSGEGGRLRPVALLAVAYGCTIGGVSTLIGTPPNAMLAAYLEETRGVTLGFGEWMRVGVPLSIIGLAGTFFLLTRRIASSSAAEELEKRIEEERARLGPPTAAEIRVGVVFLAAALAWIGRPYLTSYLPLLSDAGIAIAAALLLFLIPSGGGRDGFLLDADSFVKVPWGLLVLFGGGLSLASAMEATGAGDALGQSLGVLSGLPGPVVLICFCAGILALTELTSNTATTATFLPVAAALATVTGVPEEVILAGTALAASCAFMMPVGTPPNAVVYGSGEVQMTTMIRYGFRLNLLFLVLITFAAYAIGSFLITS